jgi:hypothetical protein
MQSWGSAQDQLLGRGERGKAGPSNCFLCCLLPSTHSKQALADLALAPLLPSDWQ